MMEECVQGGGNSEGGWRKEGGGQKEKKVKHVRNESRGGRRMK